MELLAPSLGLIIWTLLAFLHLALCIIAIVKLANLPMDPVKKVVLLLVILFVPLAGPLAFVAIRGYNSKKLFSNNYKN